MKYADSFYHAETCAAATTTYSPWFDVSYANELYMWTESVETAGTTYSIVVTVERCVPYYANPTATTVVTFTAITADATEEEHASSIGAGTDKIGMRVRFKYVNTWTSGSTGVHSRIDAKRN